MTLNDLLRQGRSITEQLNSGDIPLIDAEGKEVNIRLALSQSEDDLVCEIAFIRRELDSMTQEELEELNTLAYHNISIQDNRLCGYICGGELEDVIKWLEKQGEQKPDDKVETKFKVGDWVMYKNGACFSNGSISARVRSIEGHKVWLEHGTYVDELELKKITD